MNTTIKQIKRLFLLLCLIVAGAQSAWAQNNEAYAVINIETDVMTFYYDIFRSTHESNESEVVYSLNTGTNDPDWNNGTDNYCYYVTKVVFDNSFRNARPTSTYRWFSGMTALSEITFYNSYGSGALDYWQTLFTSEVTNMSGMFKNCQALTLLSVRAFDTSKVTDMSSMFEGCENLTSLDLKDWDTSNVTNMSNMFGNCSSLTGLDPSNWNTSNVTDMSYMFQFCFGLTGLNLNNWDTSSVTNMTHMFNSCWNLSGLNVRDWNTSNVFTMNSMFKDCRNLSVLNLKDWNTSSVTTMNSMFSGCRDLSYVNGTSNWNTSHVRDMSGLFENCFSLVTIDLSNWNTSNVTDMGNMFKNCSELETIYAGSNWNIQAVTNFLGMFTDCTKLVGGRGTVCDGRTYYCELYAHIDSPSSPGYLSDHSQEQMNLVLTAGACDKGIEVWNGDTQMGSISQEGGTFYETVNNATTLELRVPNQYLEKIILNGEDVTATLSSTTPDDPAYAGYTFYTLADISSLMVIEVQYNYVAPHPYETSSIQFIKRNYLGSGTGSIKNTKIWFEDGTQYQGTNGQEYIEWERLGMKTISRIEVTMQPDVDNFTYAQTWNTLGTIVDNGDGTYLYTIPGENLTSSIIVLYFPASNFGSVKTMISSKNDFKLGYYFGEWINMEGGFVQEYDQTNTSVLNSDVTVMHHGTQNYQAEGGGYSTGIIFVQVTQGTTFRLTEDGEDRTGDCVWRDANQTFTASPIPISYTCPVAGYYYLLKNVTTDSYIIVDNGSGEVVSPWQILQTASVVGKGTLSLLDSEGTVVKSVSGDEPTTVSWTKGDALKLRATAPEGSDLTNAQAHLFLDNDHCLMTKMTEGGNTYFEYTINEVTSAHSFILVFSGLENGGDDMLTQSVMLLGDNINSPSCVTIEWHDKNGGTYDDYQADWSDLMETSSVEKDRVNGCTVYITTSKGGSYKVFFNGQEITSFTADGGTEGSDFYTASFEDPSFLVDGTWVVVFKEAGGGISWSAMATGDMPEGASAEFIIDEDSETPMDIEVNNATSYGSGTYLSNQLPPDIQLYINVPAGYQFKVWFNGEEYTNRYWLYSTSDEGVQSWSYYTSDTEGITPLAVDGTWVIEFKKAEEEGITWSAMAIGDVAEGNRMVAMGYEDMLEVAIDNGKQYDTLTYEPQDETANMSINVLVKEGYNFRIWFNEMECTDKFANVETLSDGRVRWRFDSSDASIVAPYLQDGRWIILFYDDAERYDLNNDKKVDISDVTKLVNVILEKEQNNYDD